MLPEHEQLELNHISALLALLVEGAWGETVTQLISEPMLRKKASTIWNTWRPYLSHPPFHPTGEAAVKEEMIGLFASAYTFPPTAAEIAKSIRDYPMAALTTAAFTEYTSITLEEDPVQVTNTHARSPCLTDPSVMPSPTNRR
jgi:hypothetical protein